MHTRFTRLVLVLTLIVPMAGVARLSAADLAAAAKLISSARVLVIAHRGDSKAAPENTLPAFASAVKLGCDLVELDYHHSADGVPIVLHDYTLDRTTDARARWGEEKAAVSDKSAEDLEVLDAGVWFGDQFRETKLPTLEESLDLIQNGSTTLIERKAGDAATCIDLLRKKKMLDQVVVQAFDWDFLVDCHKIEPNLILGALGGRDLDGPDFEKLEKTGAKVVGWFKDAVTEEVVQDVHAHDMKLWVWTVDDMEVAEGLIEMGVDGIISNVPAQVKKLVRSRVMATR